MTPHPCSAIVLAGGLATRLGGLDKALVPFAGRPLITHVLARLAPQVDDIVINCNRSHEQLAVLGYPLVQDTRQDYSGPLAGIAAALPLCRHDNVLVVPCDTPFLPADLLSQLSTGMDAEHPLVIAHDGHRLQPLVMLLQRRLAPSLHAWLEAGNRKVEMWCQSENAAVTRFDDPAAFINLNTPDELAAAEKKRE